MRLDSNFNPVMRLMSRAFEKSMVVIVAGLALSVSAGSALAQETASVPDPQDDRLEQTVDAEAIYNEALEAEWAGDYTLARELYGPAAEAGHAGSHYQLGFLMMDGLGGPRDVEQARFHLREAADGGIALALVSLIYTYDDQDDPTVAPDPIIASRALLELSQRDLASAGDTIMFWSRPLRRQIQRDLRDSGHYRGAIDGLIGQGSLNALRAFARSRAELPELPERRFDSLMINSQGLSLNGTAATPFEDIETLADLRDALEALPAVATEDSHWRILSNGEALLDWPRPVAVANDDERVRAPVTFQLPGKPTMTDLTLGTPLEDFEDLNLTVCALRTPSTGPYRGRYTRRCETRAPGVQLLFLAENGPSPDLEAEVARIHGMSEEQPEGETLIAIEIIPPLSLRLAGN